MEQRGIGFCSLRAISIQRFVIRKTNGKLVVFSKGVVGFGNDALGYN